MMFFPEFAAFLDRTPLPLLRVRQIWKPPKTRDFVLNITQVWLREIRLSSGSGPTGRGEAVKEIYDLRSVPD